MLLRELKPTCTTLIAEGRMPGEYVYHASFLPNLRRGLSNILKNGLLPSVGAHGRGVYFAYTEHGGFYHVSEDEATLFRAKWEDLVHIFGLYPKTPNGIERDDDEIIVPGKIPANILEVEFFKGEWWDLDAAVESSKMGH